MKASHPWRFSSVWDTSPKHLRMRQILGRVEATDSLSVEKNWTEETTWWRVAVLPNSERTASVGRPMEFWMALVRAVDGEDPCFFKKCSWTLSQLARTGIEVVNGAAFGLNLLPKFNLFGFSAKGLLLYIQCLKFCFQRIQGFSRGFLLDNVSFLRRGLLKTLSEFRGIPQWRSLVWDLQPGHLTTRLSFIF